MMIAVCRFLEARFLSRFQIVVAHDPRNTVTANCHAVLVQLDVHASLRSDALHRRRP
jgi:hypothetical protein